MYLFVLFNRIVTYPPLPAKGGFCVTTDDYCCLAKGIYINDIIIDFYLKFLMVEEAKNDQHRYHSFSTHFSKRLISSLKFNSSENLSEKRHERVQKWTKNINIFDKDFIFIPVNKQ